MKFKRVAAYALALALMALPLLGCASSGAKGGAAEKCEIKAPSKRQQLICIRKVWKAGGMSKESYQREWARIMDGK